MVDYDGLFLIRVTDLSVALIESGSGTRTPASHRGLKA